MPKGIFYGDQRLANLVNLEAPFLVVSLPEELQRSFPIAGR